MENVVDGYCESDCYAVGIFFAVFGLFGLAGSTTRLPGLIVSLRVVEKRDKAASFTLTVSECYLNAGYADVLNLNHILVFQVAALSLFAFLPSPVIFGAIFDSACENW